MYNFRSQRAKSVKVLFSTKLWRKPLDLNTVRLRTKPGKLSIVPRVLSGIMQLKEFSLISPVIKSGTVLNALETAIPSDAIEQAIAKAKASENRKRALPSP